MAEKRIKGITIEIGGDTRKLSEALKDVNKTINSTNTELKDLQKALKLDPKNTELLAQKQELLEKQIKATTDRLNTLKEAQRQMGDYDSLTEEQQENFRALSVEISKAESSLKDLNSQLKTTNTFSLKDLNNSLSGIRELSTKLVKDLAKVSLAIGGVLTTLGVSSVKAYAEYEQLAGGVEKIFGESANDLMNYAEKGYKTAGISANQYLETATSFSASLIRGLEGDTRKATELTDRAIRDMSDNANTFGASMDEIANVYKNLSKQQYQTLDNLRLGYSGTKEGMKELIQDASTYTDIQKELGVVVDGSSLSFDNIINAISVMQYHLGITGTTTKEAEHTISGSVNQMKASWSNLLLAISDDNADMGKSVDEFIDSVITASKNIVPRIKIAIEGIKKLFNSLVRDVFPKLKREIPELAPIINIFEWFIDHKNLVMTAIKGIIGAFVITKIVDFATKIQSVASALVSFASGSVAGAFITSISTIVGAITLLANSHIFESEEHRKARLEMEKHTDSLNSQIDSWKELQETQQKTIDKGLTELSYYENLYNELEDITDANGKVQKGYEKRAEFITNELSEAFGIEIKMHDNTIEKMEDVMSTIDKLMEKKRAEVILDAQKSSYSEAKSNEAEAIQNLIYWEEQLDQAEQELETAKKERINGDVFWEQWRYDQIKHSYDQQKEVVDNYQYTIAQYEQNLVYAHEEAYDKINTKTWEYVKTYQNASDVKKAELDKDIETTQKKLDELTKTYETTGDEIYKKQIQDTERTLKKQQEELKSYTSAITQNKPNVIEAAEQMIAGFSTGISNKKSSIFNTITTLGSTILSKFKNSLKEQSPSKATREMGEFLLEGLSLGIKENENALLNQVDKLGNSVIDGLYANTMDAMRGLNSGISKSINPTINPSVAYELNYQLMANAMKEALQEVDVELDDRKVGKFIDKTISEEVFN